MEKVLDNKQKNTVKKHHQHKKSKAKHRSKKKQNKKSEPHHKNKKSKKTKSFREKGTAMQG